MKAILLQSLKVFNKHHTPMEHDGRNIGVIYVPQRYFLLRFSAILVATDVTRQAIFSYSSTLKQAQDILRTLSIVAAQSVFTDVQVKT
jgi:hypothetical protein